MIETAVFAMGIVASGVRLSTPILFAALGEQIAERSGVLNLGVEGMMLMGAFTGFIGTYFTGNIFIGLLLAISGPALMAALMAFMSVSLRTNQLVAGLAIWLLGVGLTSLLYRLIFGVVTIAPKIREIPPIDIPILSHIPVLGPILFQYDSLVYLAFLLVPVSQIFIFKTNLGLKIRTVGENPKQADALGVNVYRIRYLAVIIGGALAGIGGSYLALVTTGNFLENITAGQGWIALAVVIFGRWKPLWIVCGALIFGMVDAFQLGLQAIGTPIPSEFLLMLPYILPIAIMAGLYKRSAAPAALAISYQRGER
jgi:general nucleoside transport system permease protein